MTLADLIRQNPLETWMFVPWCSFWYWLATHKRNTVMNFYLPKGSGSLQIQGEQRA